MKLHIYLLRHGRTQGNEEKRYIGRTDESLSAAGRQEVERLRASGKIPDGSGIAALFVSPMQRCRETAHLLYPGRQQIVLEDFREIDFGDFEGKNAAELLADPTSGYQAWIDSNGTMTFPHGEARQDFIERSRRGFARMLEMLQTQSSPQPKEQLMLQTQSLPHSKEQLMLQTQSLPHSKEQLMLQLQSLPQPKEQLELQVSSQLQPGKQLILQEVHQTLQKELTAGQMVHHASQEELRVVQAAAVVHGGTIMSVLSGLCGGDYYDYMCKNAEGYRLEMKRTKDNDWKGIAERI